MTKNEKYILIIGSIISVSLLLIFLDPIKNIFYEFTSVGLSIKEVLTYSLIVTIIILIILAVISEGGLLGEVQYLLSSFLLYFFVSFIIIGYVW